MSSKQLDWVEEELRKAWEEDPGGAVAACELVVNIESIDKTFMEE